MAIKDIKKMNASWSVKIYLRCKTITLIKSNQL